MPRKLKVANLMVIFSIVSAYATSFAMFYLLANSSEKFFTSVILLSLAAFYSSAIYFYICRKKYIADTLAGIKISANAALSIRYPLIRDIVLISCTIIFILFLAAISEFEKLGIFREALILLPVSFIQFYIAVSLIKLKSWIGN